MLFFRKAIVIFLALLYNYYKSRYLFMLFLNQGKTRVVFKCKTKGSYL